MMVCDFCQNPIYVGTHFIDHPEGWTLHPECFSRMPDPAKSAMRQVDAESTRDKRLRKRS